MSDLGAPVVASPDAPTLDGRIENPFRVMAGAVAAVALAVFLSLFAPSITAAGSGIYTSSVPLSPAGQEGRSLYLAVGCAACHTQQVRRIAADAGLGGVTVSDTNQVLGTRRFGPDLAHVGSRMQTEEIDALLTQSNRHGSYRFLAGEDLESLIGYMRESK